MAKRKLSTEQRTKLREELAAGKQAGTRTPELVAEMGKKYGISEITVRYYLASLNGKKDRGASNGNGQLSRLVNEKQARAKEAKRLIASYRKLKSKELRLKRKHERLGKAVKRTGAKASSIYARIAELMK